MAGQQELVHPRTSAPLRLLQQWRVRFPAKGMPLDINVSPNREVDRVVFATAGEEREAIVMILPAMSSPLVHHNFVASRRSTPDAALCCGEKRYIHPSKLDIRALSAASFGKNPFISPFVVLSLLHRRIRMTTGWISSPTLLYDHNS